MLNSCIGPFTTNQTLSVEYSIFRIDSQLILSGVADETFAIGCECHVGRRNTITLIVSNDFYSTVFKYSDTEISE